MGENPRKRHQATPQEPATQVPPPSHRVLAIPELLSLIFSFLAHTHIAPGEDPEVSAFSKPLCTCSCSQCLRDEAVLSLGATGVLSLPSPLSVPKTRQRRRKGDDDESDSDNDEDLSSCHCKIPSHRQLSNLFGRNIPKTTPPTPNRPSYNLANALVCKAWSSVALDVLWRVVDQPERLFSLLDGSWGSKLKRIPRLRGLRGLCPHESGEGRMPTWWEPGVQAFLELEDEEDIASEEEEEPKSNSTKKREYHLFSFRSPPTPSSWARFDRYARRVRHLVYTRPCLSELAMSQIAVTRPRLTVLPRMHTLSWADNPINHAVLFMHEGVKRLELRIEVFGKEKVDPRIPVEQTFNTYAELGLNDFLFDDRQPTLASIFSLGGTEEEEDVKPNRSISRTLATQLAEIPRRMPNIQTLCISSYLPVTLYLPALLCTLFRPPTTADDNAAPALLHLRRLILPRYYTCAPILERLASFPELEVLEFQFDDALGWGRASDVGLNQCVPEGWRIHEQGGDTTDGSDANIIFKRMNDLSLTIPITEARKLLLSSPEPPTLAEAAADPSLTVAPSALPCWPQNLVCLCIDAPPGLLATPSEVRAFIQAVALACYGPSTGRDQKPARLERLGLVCSADPDSGYEASCGVYETTVAESVDEKYLTLGVFEPLLAGLDVDKQDGDTPFRPKFALKTFEVAHHFPLAFTHADIETLAQRWGGCIETLTLNCEPIASFGITVEGGLSIGSLDHANRPEATLTLAALLPLARYCTELKHLGIFVDASRGVKGLMRELSGPTAESTETNTEEGEDEETQLDESPADIDAFTSAIARRYLKAPLSNPAVTNAFPVFRKLEKLNFGISVTTITLAETKYRFSPAEETEGESEGENDEDEEGGEGNDARPDARSDVYDLDKKSLLDALRDAARLRTEDKEKAKSLPVGSKLTPNKDHEGVLDYLRRRGVRLGLMEEDEFESELLGTTIEDSSDLVPLFLAQVLPCFPSQRHSGSPNSPSKSSAFTTVIEAGTTWSGSPSGLMSASRAIQAYWTVGDPYELDKEKQRRRRRREQAIDEELEAEQQEQEQQTQSQSQPTQTADGGAASVTSINGEPDPASGSTHPAAAASATSTLVVPFFPLPAIFAEPSAYLPMLLITLFRARIKKWVSMNESVLPMAVATREAGWVWGGRVANELGTRRSEVDELQVRVDVMNGLVQTRGGASKNGRDAGGPDGCVIC